jgi:HEAT repeat protein
LDKVGTNAIPTLLWMLRQTDSPFKRKVTELVRKQHFIRIHSIPAEEINHAGYLAFRELGARAEAAVPGLIALLNDKNPDVRYTAVFALRSLGQVAGDALPSLIKCLKDPEFTVQSDAILGLGEIHQEPERVIPILVELLDKPQNPQHSVILRANAIWALVQFGAQAKPAVPVLRRFLNDGQEGIRWDLTNALKAIDPEAAAKAGVR